jgi:hypothetical protein
METLSVPEVWGANPHKKIIKESLIGLCEIEARKLCIIAIEILDVARLSQLVITKSVSL